MSRYFMHLRDGSDELLDPEGGDYPDLESMRRAVLLCARDLMAGDIRGGVIDFRFRIDAEDEDGNLVYSLPFEHALSIIPAAAATAIE
jgi:hypothetical protein